MRIKPKANKLLIFALLVTLAYNTSFTKLTFAAMSSPSYEIKWDTIGSGGSDTGSSASYQLRDTLGNMSIGPSESTSYNLRAGYRQGISDQVLTFALLPQDSSTQVEASDLTGNTVTVDSTSGFAVGDYIMIVQDEGSSQVSGMGQVVSLTATTLTVDDVHDNGTTPVLDGTADFVYIQTGVAVTFGQVDLGDFNTTTIGWEVTADSNNGYSVQVREDGNLRSGADDVNDVADGAVTVNSEEYGARSSDTTIASSDFDTEDEAFTTSLQAVGTRSDIAFKDRDFLIMKVSVSNSTQNGSYSQILTFVATGNY